MSYFSHHPEAYDQIEVKGVVSSLLSYFRDDSDDEDLRARLSEIMGEIQCPSTKYPKDRVVWDALVEWASDSIKSAEQSYWDSFVP